MTSEPEENYRKLLKSHDWYYDFSDDHSVWKRGSSERSTLSGLRRQLDPDSTIWNEYAPDMFKAKPPEPKNIPILPQIKVKKPGGPGSGP